MYNSNFKGSCRPHNQTSNPQKNISYELPSFVCSLPTFTSLVTTKFTFLPHWQFLCFSELISSLALVILLALSNNFILYFKTGMIPSYIMYVCKQFRGSTVQPVYGVNWYNLNQHKETAECH